MTSPLVVPAHAMLSQRVGWAKARRAVPTASRTVGTRSRSSGAHLRDPLALPTSTHSNGGHASLCPPYALNKGSRSRGALRPSFSSEPPSSHGEGAGKAGRRMAPMVRVQQKSTRQNHRFSRNRPAFPAQWFYGLYVVSPVNRAFLPPSPARCRSIFADLAPASGRQDHTISPSASRHSSDDVTRPSRPAPNVRDDREAPLLAGAGCADDRSDLGVKAMPVGMRHIGTTGKISPRLSFPRLSFPRPSFPRLSFQG